MMASHPFTLACAALACWKSIPGWAGPMPGQSETFYLWDRAEAARQPHKLEVMGASPIPATNSGLSRRGLLPEDINHPQKSFSKDSFLIALFGRFLPRLETSADFTLRRRGFSQTQHVNTSCMMVAA